VFFQAPGTVACYTWGNCNADHQEAEKELVLVMSMLGSELPAESESSGLTAKDERKVAVRDG
jgi:hypothetical protein